MREIKFRAWLPDNAYYLKSRTNKMYEVFSVDKVSADLIVEGLCNSVLKKYIILMQFTGLLDKNGKEIYEGDVVSRFGDTQRAIVEFKNGCFVSIIQLSGYDEPHEEILCNDLSVTEIIGNIYENPDLLTPKE